MGVVPGSGKDGGGGAGVGVGGSPATVAAAAAKAEEKRRHNLELRRINRAWNASLPLRRAEEEVGLGQAAHGGVCLGSWFSRRGPGGGVGFLSAEEPWCVALLRDCYASNLLLAVRILIILRPTAAVFVYRLLPGLLSFPPGSRAWWFFIFPSRNGGGLANSVHPLWACVWLF